MYKRLTLEGLEWVKYASKDMKKRTSKKRKHSKKRKYTKKRKHKKGGNKIPKKYTARLSKKDKAKQTKSIKRAIKSYKKGKYIDRPKLKSYKSKKSSWVVKFEKKYGEDIKSYKQIAKATGIPIKALKAVVKKGKGHIIVAAVDPIKQQNHGVKKNVFLYYGWSNKKI